MSNTLDEYVKQAQASGLSQEEIVANLRASGWDEAAIKSVTKKSPQKTKKIALLVSIVVLIIIGGTITWGMYRQRNTFGKPLPSPARVEFETTPVNDAWQQIKEDNRYTIEIPTYLAHQSMLYFAQMDGYKSLRSVRISFDSISSESLSSIVDDLTKYAKEPIKHVIMPINNAQAAFFEPRIDEDGSGSMKVVLQGSTGLVYILDLDSQTFEQDRDLLTSIAQSFTFVEEPPTPEQTYTLSGQVFQVSGNCMPGASSNCTRNNVPSEILLFPIQRTHGAGNMESADQQPLYSIKTDAEGNYSHQVARGSYTAILVEEDGGYYCTSWTGSGIACPVHIFDQDVEHNLKLDYAVY